jgi:hypothetical protein
VTTTLAHRDPFGRHTPMVLDFEFIWHGWRRSTRPTFCPVPRDNPLATIWRWQFFIGPVEIRRWVPIDSPAPGNGGGRP